MKIKSILYGCELPDGALGRCVNIQEAVRLTIVLEDAVGRETYLFVTWHGFNPDAGKENWVYISDNYSAAAEHDPACMHLSESQTHEQVEEIVMQAFVSLGVTQ